MASEFFQNPTKILLPSKPLSKFRPENLTNNSLQNQTIYISKNYYIFLILIQTTKSKKSNKNVLDTDTYMIFLEIYVGLDEIDKWVECLTNLLCMLFD